MDYLTIGKWRVEEHDRPTFAGRVRIILLTSNSKYRNRSTFSYDVWKVYNKNNSRLPNNAISALATDDYDRLWIASEEGVCSFDGSEWNVYKTAKKKMKHYIIYVDKNDNKWIGTEKALIVLNQDGIEEKLKKKVKQQTSFTTTNNITKNNTKISYFLPGAPGKK